MARISNFELLRIICINGIITMHSFGCVYGSATGLNLAVGVLINSVFNSCVSCFVLMSGYFGIKYNLKKILNLHFQIIFITISALTINYYFTGNLSKLDFVKSIFPIISRKYWFISCYVVLTFLAPFINQIPEKLSRKSFESLLLILITIFYIIPSFFYFELTMDGGKGIVNMIIVYLIGRYINKYITNSYPIKSLFIIALFIAVVNSSLNYFFSQLHGGVGLFAPFARDSSIFILVLAILTLLIFREMQFKSKIINYLASSVLIVYIGEGYVRTLLNHFFDLTEFSTSLYFTLMLFLYVMAVFFITTFIDIVRRYTVGRFDSVVIDYEIRIINMVSKKIFSMNILISKIKHLQSTGGNN